MYFLHLCCREQLKQMYWNSWLTLGYRQYQLKIQGCSVAAVLWGFMHTILSTRNKGKAKPHNIFPKKHPIHPFKTQLCQCLFLIKMLQISVWFHFKDRTYSKISNISILITDGVDHCYLHSDFTNACI